MSRVCQVTGKSPLVGHNVSHSNRHTKRRFEINLKNKRFWVEDEKRWITLKVSARGMRRIDKLGLPAVLAELRERGEPGAVIAALDAATGAVRWKIGIDSSEWSVITSIAAAGNGFVVGGSFSGSLRAASKIVSSAGKIDGFVARLSGTGDVEWLIRV